MREEIENLLIQADEDLKTAQVLLEVERFYACVFFAQQAAEKSLKALYQQVHRRLILTHDLTRIVQELDAPDDIKDAARKLTPDYTGTRYPDAVGGVPAYLFSREDAEGHLALSSRVVAWVKERLQAQ